VRPAESSPVFLTLVLRSSKAVDKTAAQVAMRAGWRAPDPGLGAMIKLVRGKAGDVVDLFGVGKGLAGAGLVPQQAPPAFLEMEPACTRGRKMGETRGWASSQS
jgi:hypothetical protein